MSGAVKGAQEVERKARLPGRLKLGLFLFLLLSLMHCAHSQETVQDSRTAGGLQQPSLLQRCQWHGSHPGRLTDLEHTAGLGQRWVRPGSGLPCLCEVPHRARTELHPAVAGGNAEILLPALHQQRAAGFYGEPATMAEDRARQCDRRRLEIRPYQVRPGLLRSPAGQDASSERTPASMPVSTSLPGSSSTSSAAPATAILLPAPTTSMASTTATPAALKVWRP